MPFVYKVEVMPSGSVVDTSWLDSQGSSGWELIQIVPMSPIVGNGHGSIMCYFKSGSV